MYEYLKLWLELKVDRRAVTSLEYALIAGIVVTTVVTGFNNFATHLSTKFNTIGTSL